MTATTPSSSPRPTTDRKPPRFNHVGLSIAGDLLDADGRAKILDFYGDVFGWQELPTETVDGRKLVMMCHRFDQFVFLVANDAPMHAPRLDHFGQSVATVDELHETYARAKAFADRDPEVDLIDVKVESHPGLDLHAWYVGYRLPVMIETQYWDWK
jgi:hypothetical protein